jgi:fumarate hydratase subunit alpha
VNIEVEKITDSVAEMCKESNYYLGKDIINGYYQALEKEESSTAKNILKELIKNAEIAAAEKVPVCQDTGMVIVFVEIGQNVNIKGGSLNKAINKGVSRGYKEGYLRKSVVNDPLIRKNTGDNTPAVIHTEIVPGSHLKLSVIPKGFGSENMSRIKMLKPTAGIKGIKEFILETVEKAGPNPCPPIVVGVGIGGTFEKAALLSKKSLLREIGKNNSDKNLAELESSLLKDINNLDIGPQGFGGLTTALAVNIESYPTHIAALPVAINISCHASRHQSRVFS